MRFFKHGAVLAISLPESLRLKLGISENDEYDFLETQPGVLALVRKGQFVPADNVKQSPTPALSKPSATIPASKPPAQKPTSAWPASTATVSAPGPVQKTSTASPSSSPQKTGAGTYAATNTLLDRQGFLVLSTEDEAKGFSYRFESQIKSGDIKGVRGFDKKFYLAARAYTEAFADKLLVALKEPKTSADLSTTLKQPVEGVLTLLYLLKEEGEVIEKKRGLFARVL